MAILESARSWAESHVILETDEYGDSIRTDYKSDTSIFYEDIEKQFAQEDFLVTNLVLDDDIIYHRTEFAVAKDWALFTFYITNYEFSQHSGRVVWIDITAPPAAILLQHLAPGTYVAVFEYPGDGNNLYIKRNSEWRFTSPVTSNLLYISTPLTDIQEMAIASDIIDESTIVLRRTFNESTVTSQRSTT